MFPAPGRVEVTEGRREGRRAESRRELNLLSVCNTPSLLREEIPVDFWPLSGKRKPASRYLTMSCKHSSDSTNSSSSKRDLADRRGYYGNTTLHRKSNKITVIAFLLPWNKSFL